MLTARRRIALLAHDPVEAVSIVKLTLLLSPMFSKHAGLPSIDQLAPSSDCRSRCNHVAILVSERAGSSRITGLSLEVLG